MRLITFTITHIALQVITLLLDDSPLPTKDSVIEVAEMIKADTTTTSIPCERNFCVILGCLAEKLAGPCSIAILTDATLEYLFKNITSDETRTDVKLFSLIALGEHEFDSLMFIFVSNSTQLKYVCNSIPINKQRNSRKLRRTNRPSRRSCRNVTRIHW